MDRVLHSQVSFPVDPAPVLKVRIRLSRSKIRVRAAVNLDRDDIRLSIIDESCQIDNERRISALVGHDLFSV